VLSTHLTSEERRALQALATELDGLPFVEKAERMRAHVRELRCARARALTGLRPAGAPVSIRRAA
jgi:hypothetical protein